MVTDGNVRALVDAFAADLEALIKDEIRRGFEAAMGNTSLPARRPGKGGARVATSPSGAVKTNVDPKFARPGRKKGEKRTPAQLLAVKEALAAFIEKTPGKRIEEISAVLKVPTKDLSRPLHKLIAEKRVRQQGEKRASRYFPGKK